jgi:hypothetical protein
VSVPDDTTGSIGVVVASVFASGVVEAVSVKDARLAPNLTVLLVCVAVFGFFSIGMGARIVRRVGHLMSPSSFVNPILDLSFLL